MLFNSYIYIFALLPITFLCYFALKRYNLSNYVLIGSSLFFYGYWNIIYLPLIIGSVIVNFLIAKKVSNQDKKWLGLGIGFNVLLLGIFKYSDFFIGNINYFSGSNIDLLHLALPLAISFFTFQQIAYLVDTYKGYVKENSFIKYMTFVTFFPQLIAGPIVHHKEMMPQFSSLKNKTVRYKYIALGVTIFSIGLFKKVVIADSFAVWANHGFDEAVTLSLIEGWTTSLSYTFQLYFDFSGYTDMAIGSALLFNIKLPINFHSPYKALNIQDFWRRWHITLSRFLRDYIYIPLGGNKSGLWKVYRNILIVFLIGGIWHGAGWTYVFWGLLHGIAMVVFLSWQKLNIKLPKIIAWLITFNFINFSWIFFRAESWDSALKVINAMVSFDIKLDVTTASFLNSMFSFEYFKFYHSEGLTYSLVTVIFIVAAFFIVFNKNSTTKIYTSPFKPSFKTAFGSACLFIFSLLFMLNSGYKSEFLYFQF